MRHATVLLFALPLMFAAALSCGDKDDDDDDDSTTSGACYVRCSGNLTICTSGTIMDSQEVCDSMAESDCSYDSGVAQYEFVAGCDCGDSGMPDCAPSWY